MTTPTLNQRMLAPANMARTISANGRTYSVSASGYMDMPAHDAGVAESNGFVAMPACLGVGTSAQRPAANTVSGLKPAKNDTFLDTTLGYVVLFDGVNWRNPISGAVV